jgi:hypothetical protein
MKKVTFLLMTLGLLLAMGPVQAGKPGSGVNFFAEFTGAVEGSATSNSTANKGNIANLVFNKPASNVDFNFLYDFVGLEAQTSCFPGGPYEATMHLLDDSGNDAELSARFWFRAGGISYVLELFDSAPAWSGQFPPFNDVGTITRSTESWQIRTTSKKTKSPCTVSGDFDSIDVVTLTLCLDSMKVTDSNGDHCP